MESLEILETAVKTLDAKKAVDIKAIKVDDITILADYFVIAMGMSSTQVKALADEVDYKLSEAGVEPGHIEGKSSGWILLDYGTVVVHVFTREARDTYDLERLWADGEKCDITEIIDNTEAE